MAAMQFKLHVCISDGSGLPGLGIPGLGIPGSGIPGTGIPAPGLGVPISGIPEIRVFQSQWNNRWKKKFLKT